MRFHFETIATNQPRGSIMTYQIIKDYLETLAAHKMAEFDGSGYAIGSTVVEFGDEGFEVRGKPVTVAEIKKLVKNNNFHKGL
jgi:hypothetical protein